MYGLKPVPSRKRKPYLRGIKAHDDSIAFAPGINPGLAKNRTRL
jgi:hypothetical protein